MAKKAQTTREIIEQALTEGYLLKFQYPQHGGEDAKLVDRHFLPARLWLSREGNLSVFGWEYTKRTIWRTRVINGIQQRIKVGMEVTGWHRYSLDKIVGIRLAAQVDVQEAWAKTYQQNGIFPHCFKEGAERLVIFPTPALGNDSLNRLPYVIPPEQLESRLAAGWTVKPVTEPGASPVYVRKQ